MLDSKRDFPDVIAKPPLLFIIFIIVGLDLEYVWPLWSMPDVWRYSLGISVLIVSFTFSLLGIAQFKRMQTNVAVWKPATAVVRTGVYAISRNPIYLGMFLFIEGLAFSLSNMWLLILLPLLFMIMHYGVVLREERYLTQKFGDLYLSYKSQVRRWV